MEIPKTKEEIRKARLLMLEETVEIYTKHSKRCIEEGDCKYYSKNSIGCAIGARIKDKELCKEFDARVFYSGVNSDAVFKELPLLLQSLGKEFLADIQKFHDKEWNWKDNSKTGFHKLTKEGLRNMNRIKINYNLIEK